MLSYDDESGTLRWNETRGKAKAGAVAGCPTGDGRLQVTLDQHNALAHHWVWLIQTGTWPPAGIDIDHADGDPTNNRWKNLRLLSRGHNMQNVLRPNSHNRSGFRGVDFHRGVGRWRSCIKVDGKQIVLGYFDSAEEASGAYLRAKAGLHPAWSVGR